MGGHGKESSMSEENDTLDLASGRYLNESAIRAHALRCSQNFRNGKFTRVGFDFIDEVKTDVECLVRELRGKAKTQLHEPLESTERFITGALMEKVELELDRVIARMIQNKMQRQPSCGCTAGATR